MALDAAREVLVEDGPQAVTLKAVAKRIDRTHANLLHHFGSAAGLQKALAEHLSATVCGEVAEAIRAARAGVASPRKVVDIAFDAFDREGGGALVGWMITSGQDDAIAPFVETIHRMVADLDPDDSHPGHKGQSYEATLGVVLLALGNALIGGPLAASLALPEDHARDLAERLVVQTIAARSGS